MKLTDSAIRNLRPGDKPRKVFDGDSLYLYRQEAERLARSASFETVANEWVEIQPTKLTPNSVAWLEADIAAFAESRPIARLRCAPETLRS